MLVEGIKPPKPEENWGEIDMEQDILHAKAKKAFPKNLIVSNCETTKEIYHTLEITRESTN